MWSVVIMLCRVDLLQIFREALYSWISHYICEQVISLFEYVFQWLDKFDLTDEYYQLISLIKIPSLLQYPFSKLEKKTEIKSNIK